MTDAKYPPKSNDCKCADCDRPYGDDFGFPDLIVPNDVWRRISPTGDLAGALCPSCICARLANQGITGVPAAFMSGPIDSIDRHTMHALRWTENLREGWT